MSLTGSREHVTKPVDAVTAYYRRFDEGATVAELCEVFADDVEYTRPGKVLHGIAEVAAHLSAAPRVDGPRHLLHRVVADGAVVVVEGRMTGRIGTRGLDVPFAEVWDVGPDQRVTRRAAYFDTALLA